MSGRVWLITVFALMGGQVLAKPGTPGPAYFAGTFERVGRTGGDTPRLLNDRVVVVPDGVNVIMNGCTGPVIHMSFGPAFEIVNLMTGDQAGVPVDCLFHNNGYNRPILSCQIADGGAFTMWPLSKEALACKD